MNFEERDRLDAGFDNFDFETIFLKKLSDDELQEINYIIKDYDDNNKQNIIQKINTLNNTFMQEYDNYLLTDKIAKNRTHKLHNRLKKSKKNRKINFSVFG